MAVSKDGNGRRAAGNGRIVVGVVAAEAYRSVFGRLGLVLELAWLPLLLLLAAMLIPGLVTGYVMPDTAPATAGDHAGGVSLGDVVEAGIALLCLNAFAVRWHQAMLLPDPHRVAQVIFRRAWARFVLYTLVFNLVLAALSSGAIAAGVASGALSAAARLASPPLLLAAFAGAALTIVAVLAMLRCALLLPAAAVGQPLSPAAAWTRMRGNTWRLIGGIFIVCVPVVAAVLLVLNVIFAAAGIDAASIVGSGEMPLGVFILEGVVGTMLNFITVALVASVLCGFYRRIVLRAGSV